MSTTFAIIKDNKTFEIAHRYGLGGGRVGIKWYNINSILDAIMLLNGYTDKTKIKVYPMDNTAQGVNNIGDLIKLDRNGRL